jgi:hypothetical protein
MGAAVAMKWPAERRLHAEQCHISAFTAGLFLDDD